MPASRWVWWCWPSRSSWAGRVRPAVTGRASERTIAVEVPALLGGVRVDRGVAMVADVSRAVATELIASGRVLVDEVTVTRGTRPPAGGLPDHRLAARTRGRPGRGRARRGVPGGPRRRRRGGDRQAGRPGRPSRGRPPRRHPGRWPHVPVPRAGRAGRRRRLPGRSTRDRAPARQGHLGPHGGGPHRVGLRVPGGAAGRPEHAAAYLALVEGSVGDDRGEIDAPDRSVDPDAHQDGGLGQRPGGPHGLYRAASGAPGRGRPPLLELRLESGRTHQIRVHMAAIGHPVVGDARYGTPDRAIAVRAFFPPCLPPVLHPPSKRRAGGVLGPATRGPRGVL